MIPDLDLGEKLVKELMELDTADEIAAVLISHGVRALPGLISLCAVSEYVRQRSGAITTTSTHSVCMTDKSRETSNSSRRVVMGNKQFMEFLYKFDDGKYPELLIDGVKNDGENWTFHGQSFAKSGIIESLAVYKSHPSPKP